MASMGPRPRGRGIAPYQSTPEIVPSRFNGATTARSWNSGQNRPAVEIGFLLQWGHDRAVVEFGRRVRHGCYQRSFNGATTARSWNSPWVVWHLITISRASMGPRPRGRGIKRVLRVGREVRWRPVAIFSFNLSEANGAFVILDA